MKKHLGYWAFSAMLVAALTACGKKDEAPAAAAPAAAASAPAPVAAEEKVLNVYNWPDYVAKDMVANFEKETGIKVNYQTFENNEALHAKLDKTKIANYGNLDPAIMEKLGTIDPGNAYLVPWAWSFTTVGINKAKVTKALGSTPMPENAWDLVFNPVYTAKLKACGIAYLDSPTEVLPPPCGRPGRWNTRSCPGSAWPAAALRWASRGRRCRRP